MYLNSYSKGYVKHANVAVLCSLIVSFMRIAFKNSDIDKILPPLIIYVLYMIFHFFTSYFTGVSLLSLVILTIASQMEDLDFTYFVMCLGGAIVINFLIFLVASLNDYDTTKLIELSDILHETLPRIACFVSLFAVTSMVMDFFKLESQDKAIVKCGYFMCVLGYFVVLVRFRDRIKSIFSSHLSMFVVSAMIIMYIFLELRYSIPYYDTEKEYVQVKNGLSSLERGDYVRLLMGLSFLRQINITTSLGADVMMTDDEILEFINSYKALRIYVTVAASKSATGISYLIKPEVTACSVEAMMKYIDRVSLASAVIEKLKIFHEAYKKNYRKNWMKYTFYKYERFLYREIKSLCEKKEEEAVGIWVMSLVVVATGLLTYVYTKDMVLAVFVALFLSTSFYTAYMRCRYLDR